MMYARCVLAWCVNGEAIGHSSLKDIVPGDSGSIHLHMWRADLRGEGHGSHLFCLAVVDFYKRFKLRRMICEPKADNLVANRLLRRIGFPFIFTRVGKSSELSAVCKLNRYDIGTRDCRRLSNMDVDRKETTESKSMDSEAWNLNLR